MSRQRLTKKADPYTLGRDKENPKVEKYMTGDPSTWAEDPDMEHRWENEPREETGHAAKGKADKEAPAWPKSAKENAMRVAKELKAKAINCVRIAEAMFPKASEEFLENQGFDLMELSDRAIKATIERLESYEGESKEAASDEVTTELRDLLAKTKKLVAEAEGEMKAEEEKPEAAEADEDEKKEEEAAEEEEEAPAEMSEQEKKASILTKKAKVLVAEAEVAEEEGNAALASEKKEAAKALLASAKKVLAGELPPALAENAEKMKEEKAPEAAEVDNSKLNVTASDKKAEALKHLEAAKKLMAEVAEVEKAESASTSSASNENPSADALTQEHPAAESAEEDAEGEKKEEEKAEAAEGDCDDMGMGMDDDLDMIPSESDEELDGLFMSPEDKEAQEAYEGAFGGGAGEQMGEKEASAPKQKKGAKTLKAGLKISSAGAADELSNLWDCPPDVSHVFK